jgi:hypothetical protein
MVAMQVKRLPRSRWRWFAILLAAVWFVALAVAIWSRDIRSNTDFLYDRLGTCLEFLDRANQGLPAVNPEEREGKRSANWTKFQDCEARAESLFSQMSDDQANAVPLLLVVDFVTVLIGWLLIGCTVLLARRIGRGFAAERG